MSDFVIENGVLKKYTGAGGDVVIPDGVTEIGERAFGSCKHLTSVTIPDSVKKIGKCSFQWCDHLRSLVLPNGVMEIEYSSFADCCFQKFINPHASDPEFFRMEGQTLLKYTGHGGDVEIPDGVRKIEYNAFSYCSCLTSVTIPDSVTEIDDCVFDSCKSLQNISIPDSVEKLGYSVFSNCTELKWVKISKQLLDTTHALFGAGGRTIELHLVQDGKIFPPMIASFLKERYYSSFGEYLLPLDEKRAVSYDKLLICGECDGFRMNEDGRLQAMLYRMKEQQFPMSEETIEVCISMLKEKLPKLIKAALQNQDTVKIRELIDIKLITDDNRKKVMKLLSDSDDSEIRSIFEGLQSEQNATAPAKEKKSTKAKAPVVQTNAEKTLAEKCAERIKKLNEKTVFARYSLDKVPEVRLKNSTDNAPVEYLTLILAAYLSQFTKHSSYSVEPLADEAAAQLDWESLLAVLRNLYESHATPGQNSYWIDKNKAPYLLPLVRYCDGKEITELYREYEAKGKGKDFAARLLCLNDSREAVLLADKKKLLVLYANVRGCTTEFLQDTILYDFGLDAEGHKILDLGNKQVQVTLQNDLSLTLLDLSNSKTVKSIPSKGADADLLEKAKSDFADLKKNIKKAAQSKQEHLLEEFLNDREQLLSDWQKAYLTNPLLRQIANLLVWEQNGVTFTLSGKDAILVDGTAYSITDNPIKLAHPMEMKAAEVMAWQKYFNANGLKQPFAQIWEPVYDLSAIDANRYSGIHIPAYRFSKQEKHGISFNFEFDISEAYLTLNDCALDFDGGTAIGRHELDLQGELILGTFAVKKPSRQANHIVSLLDKWTVYGRIIKDDVTVMEQLGNANIAQLMEYIRVAGENNAVNVTAALMDYKNEHFADFDPMDEFVL